MSYYAGIDAGTQSIKVLVYDAEARVPVEEARASLDLIEGSDGTREQQAEWWTSALRQCFQSLAPATRSRIRALSVSAQQHGFVPLSAAGEVLAPVKLWCDTATTEQCFVLTRALGGESEVIRLTGNPLLTGYTASKLLWTKLHRSDAYEAMAHVLLPHDYLNFYLTGKYYSEFGDASGTGWFDVRTRSVAKQVLAAIDSSRDLSRCLPTLCAANTLHAIRAEIADLLGLARTVQVGAGGGDNMMSAIGTGCITQSELNISLGTSGTLFFHADTPVISEQGKWAAFCSSSGGWLPLICTMNCTLATESIAGLFDVRAKDADELILQSKPGASGITVLPFFNGERTPNLPLAKGTIFGLEPMNMMAANLYRAAMEGACFGLKLGYSDLLAAGHRFKSITLTGGGSNSDAWRQMISDVFALPVRVPNISESAAFGAALAAMWADQVQSKAALTLQDAIAGHIQYAQSCARQPNVGVAIDYERSYQRYRHHLASAHSVALP
jgi:xylulokinase